MKKPPLNKLNGEYASPYESMKTSTQLKNMFGPKPRRFLVLIGLTIITGFSMTSCVMTEGYGYNDGYGSSYATRYPRYDDSVGHGQRNYYHGSGRGYYNDHNDNHRSRRSSDYHVDDRHDHPSTTSSNKFRLLNYREDKKSSHPSGYHDADYWKSRGYSVKKNTFEKKDGKIVGSRKGKKDSHRH